MVLLNFTLLFFLHRSVRRELRRRKIYSNALIVELFSHLFAYHKARMAERERTWQRQALEKAGIFAQASEHQQAGVAAAHPAQLRFDPKSNAMI